MRICVVIFSTHVIYEVAKREKQEVNLYYDYRRKYIFTWLKVLTVSV